MVKKSYAKVNIFLKIAGKRNNYHELVSRFVRVKNLYDTISFIEKKSDTFILEGNFGCQMKKNTIYKAYLALVEVDKKVEEYFKNYYVTVDKKIPEFAGLGGGSSNAATFMLMVNEVCKLDLSKDKLAQIGVIIGADVPFFIYEYNSANVTGIGESVTKFEEEELNIETVTPKIACNTGVIFSSFRDKFYKEVSQNEREKLLSMCSAQVLRKYDINEANDLYLPAVTQYEELKSFEKENWYFSGSGSSFFRVVEDNE